MGKTFLHNFFLLLGNNFKGENKTYKAENIDFHITLIEKEEDKIFDDRVNSAFCSCSPGITVNWFIV